MSEVWFNACAWLEQALGLGFLFLTLFVSPFSLGLVLGLVL